MLYPDNRVSERVVSKVSTHTSTLDTWHSATNHGRTRQLRVVYRRAYLTLSPRRMWHLCPTAYYLAKLLTFTDRTLTRCPAPCGSQSSSVVNNPGDASYWKQQKGFSSLGEDPATCSPPMKLSRNLGAHVRKLYLTLANA
jgi:hypothetical protein